MPFLKTCLLYLCAALGLVCTQGFTADAGREFVMQSDPQAWVLMDGTSGFVMNSYQKDVQLNPGDLVQIMSLYTALDMIEQGKIDREARIVIPSEAVTMTQSTRRLFLVPGEKHRLQMLLHSIAVLGAEDSVIAVASALAENPTAFAEDMNAGAAKLGMKNSRFSFPVNDAGNITTVHDLAILVMRFKQHFPEAYKWFSEREFRYGSRAQRNRNLLLWKGSGINGVMSNLDNTDIVGSWHRDASTTVMPRDVVAVLMGANSSDSATSDMQNLLQRGRLEYETVRLFPAGTVIKKIDILSGNRQNLEVGSSEAIWVTVSRKDLVSRGTGGFSTEFEYLAPAVAPVKQGEEVGTLRVFFEGKHIAAFALVALHDVGPGSFISRFVDSVRLRMKPEGSICTESQNRQR